jgi:ribosomal protein S18 acetylase RimI-like enzyme
MDPFELGATGRSGLERDQCIEHALITGAEQHRLQSRWALWMTVPSFVIEVARVRREEYGHQVGGYRHVTVSSVEPPQAGSDAGSSPDGWSSAASRRRPLDGGALIFRAGGRSLRVTPWPADPHTAQLTPVPGDPGPTPESLRAVLDDVAAAGYSAAVTGALTRGERDPFSEAGFEPLAWLHLLERSLGNLPALPAVAPPLRRLRRTDWPIVASLDDRAFPPFWHLGVKGIVDARRATPSNRMRIAVGSEGQVIGYTVFGRSGPRGFIQRLAVDPGAQGRGTGTTLVVDGLRWLAARGAISALVNTQLDNDRALDLYVRLGFKLQRERLAVLGRPIGGAA